jgi:ferric-dicitrate binding protein FerR (iron transport regulator)
MPYKNPEHKRQWEQEHREQRNAKRRTQRLDAGSGQTTMPKPANPIAAALDSVRKPAPDPASNQKPQGRWKALLGLAIGIGAVLLAAFAGASRPDTGTYGSGK